VFCIYPSHDHGPIGFWTSFFWVVYAQLVAHACSGFIAWVILLGSLWGPWKKEVPLNLVWIGLSMVLKGPFIVLAHGAVTSVRMCQRWFCGHVLEEEDLERSGLDFDSRLRLDSSGEEGN
jgi:hypothetical protein